ncbi:MAG: DNA helicase RecQ [Elusimicrobiota bacterium]|jgi:ATP-dependent DNA helicase RecQ|nr:DNA helicase RecQ [Elusimicrobiota bacterium]
MTPQEALNKVYGYHSFLGLQESVINAVMAGRDAMALMPTGGGKSLCYQIPALCLEGTAIVISPLISLMQDQVSALKQLGIKAAALNSLMEPAQLRQTNAELFEGKLDLLYISPEKLCSEGFLDAISRIKIPLFAIDEAHCISQWGHDFRPEYTQLAVLKQRFPRVPLLALTATADELTRKDIVKNLNAPQAQIFIASFDRPNITYSAAIKDQEKKQLLHFIETKHPGASGIVYCLSRKRAERFAELLKEHGYNALAYHAGLDGDTRRKNQDIFTRQEGVIMCATNAFGMGIHKPDVRFVVHMDLPKSVEAYYQETGRAGRDGLPSSAMLFYGTKDIVQLRHFIETSNAPEKQKTIERQKLNMLAAYAQSPGCRRKTLLNYFAQDYAAPCDGCDNCLTPPQPFDATLNMQKFLSCVHRAAQASFAFGAQHIIDILLGKDLEKIQKFGHQNLSTFAIGQDTPESDWKSLAQQAILSGLVRADPEHSALTLTPAAWPVLKGLQKVQLCKFVKPAKALSKKEKRNQQTQQMPAADNALFERLRALRRALAERENVPPYVVFSDKALLEMAALKPKTTQAFADINGVGAFKLEKYAAVFLEEINKGEQE